MTTKSTKHTYRVATAAGGKFQVQMDIAFIGPPMWGRVSLDQNTKEEAQAMMESLIANDDFTPEEVTV